MIGPSIRKAIGHRRRLRTGVLGVGGAVIVAAGVIIGVVVPASAHAHRQPQAASSAPQHGGRIPNLTLVENKIEAYYGNVDKHVSAGNPIFKYTGATEHLPSPSSNYAREMHGIERTATTYLRAHGGRQAGKQAVVFDVDDTLLNTYNYEIALQFGFDPTSNGVFVDSAAFPAVFGMPSLVNWAGHHGYTVFFITGRPTTQRNGTVVNLHKDGYRVPDGPNRLYLKNTTHPPSYQRCGTSCTTVQYKSAARRHIESMGYRIAASFGDQFSDLKGGFAQRTFKLPNPMYFLP